MSDGPDLEFESFLAYLSNSRNFDFTAYKRASLKRRIQKRMHEAGIESYTDYQDYLEVHPEEFTQLFNTILINVTSFFRDPPAWDFLAKEVIPAIIGEKPPADPIRVWSAGCASGEEAYSLSMLLAEQLGINEFRQRVKVYATDVDEDALNQARQATYSRKAMTAVPEEYRDKYFDPVNGGSSAFKKELRRNVIFGRHDLLSDAPISRVDLLVCRNTLMYLNSDSQARVLSRFYFALANRGYMFLGKAETLLTHTSNLTPIDMRYRIFSKIARSGVRERPALPKDGASAVSDVETKEARMRELSFELDPVAQIIVDAQGVVTSVNQRAREMFGVHNGDLGRPLQDLEISYRPVELRSLIERSYTEGRPVVVRDVQAASTVQTRWLDVYVMPLEDERRNVLGVTIVFEDVTRQKELQQQLQQSKNELETAYEELQSTNEELETTNEELQSTVEELETTNEELQSTNEELETMNEELQSTNEELETVNSEMRVQGTHIHDVNAFLESILSSLRVAVVVLDTELAITAWNRKAEDLWGLRVDELLGRPFMNLDIGLPVEQLKQLIRDCLRSAEAQPEIVLAATNRRGKAIQCRVSCAPLNSGAATNGVILLMEDDGGSRAQPSMSLLHR